MTWSVQPTPSPAPGGAERPNFSFDLQTGATINDSIRVRNFGTAVLPLSIYASDAMTTATGALDLLPAGREPTDVGKWIVLRQSTIDVPPGGFADVPFVLVVPAGAESGDHTGGIVTSYRSAGTDVAGKPVVLDRRLGSRVHVRVAGELEPRLRVTQVEAHYRGTANPTSTGTLQVSYTVTNAGNVRLGARQKVVVPGRLGFPGREVALDDMAELLPGNSLTYSVEVPSAWPTVRTAARVELTPVPTRAGDRFDRGVPVATASAGVWAVPWTLLVGLVSLIGLALLTVRARRRRRRYEAAQVDLAARTAAILQAAVDAALVAEKPGAVDHVSDKMS